jgi:16S rRNA processing protein RimM
MGAVEGAFLAVARFRKPHGLKGEAVLWVLTDDPENVLRAGQRLTPVDESGRVMGAPLTIERSRPYHRQWLVKFQEIADRTQLEGWNQLLLGVRRGELSAPGQDEAYVHELPGMQVVAAGRTVGRVKELLEIPTGWLLAVDTDGREVLVPFLRSIVTRIDREHRCIEIDPPAGLLEL